MLLKTILNRVAPQKSFVYGKVTLVSKGKQLALEVEIQPRRNSRAVSPGAIVSDRGMIDCLYEGSSSCRSGRSLCSLSTP